MLKGTFINFDLPTLLRYQTQFDACLMSIATAHQSYSIAGRTFTRADIDHVASILGEIGDAIKLKTTGVRRAVYSDMSH